MRILTLLGLVLFVSTAAIPQSKSATNAAAAASMERKLQHIESNASVSPPDSTPTELTEQEVNAYFASGKINLPSGVRSVVFQGQPGVVTATSRVDFDQFKAGQDSSNPLLEIFNGVHDIVVAAHAHGAGGQGVVKVDSVSLDGVEIPRFVLQLFVERYIQPRYPEAGLDSRFRLPDRIDAARVGLHKLTITQK